MSVAKDSIRIAVAKDSIRIAVAKDSLGVLRDWGMREDGEKRVAGLQTV